MRTHLYSLLFMLSSNHINSDKDFLFIIKFLDEKNFLKFCNKNKIFLTKSENLSKFSKK